MNPRITSGATPELFISTSVYNRHNFQTSLMQAVEGRQQCIAKLGSSEIRFRASRSTSERAFQQPAFTLNLFNTNSVIFYLLVLEQPLLLASDKMYVDGIFQSDGNLFHLNADEEKFHRRVSLTGNCSTRRKIWLSDESLMSQFWLYLKCFSRVDKLMRLYPPRFSCSSMTIP